jgi:hypothetical protein
VRLLLQSPMLYALGEPRLAVVDSTGMLAVWDAASGECLGTVSHGYGVERLRAYGTSDGGPYRLVTGGHHNGAYHVVVRPTDLGNYQAMSLDSE